MHALQNIRVQICKRQNPLHTHTPRGWLLWTRLIPAPSETERHTTTQKKKIWFYWNSSVEPRRFFADKEKTWTVVLMTCALYSISSNIWQHMSRPKFKMLFLLLNMAMTFYHETFENLWCLMILGLWLGYQKFNVTQNIVELDKHNIVCHTTVDVWTKSAQRFWFECYSHK